MPAAISVGSNDLARIVADPPLVENHLECEPGSVAARALPREACDIDKAWASIHFVLTGKDMEPGGEPHHDFLLFAGENIGDIDVGYGPARAIGTQEVAKINAALEPITPEAFQARFDHETLTSEGVYGVGPDEEEEREYAGVLYNQLRKFVNAAAGSGAGLVVALT